MIVIYILFGALVATGIFLILADAFRIPYLSTVLAESNYGKRQKARRKSLLDAWLESVALWISKRIRLNEYKRLQLQTDITSAGLTLSPEMYVSNCIVKSLLVAVFAIPMAFIFPLGSMAILIVAIALFFTSRDKLSKTINEKRTNIEAELLLLVNQINKTLRHNRDVLFILDNYRSIASPDLKRELDITIADMRSANYESALTRLETRVGSSMMSDVTRGLISVLRGDETELYWQALELKFSDYQRQILKKKALKIPAKVRTLSMIMLVCFVLIYIVVMALVIFQNMQVLF